jgi:hypothetical protein
MSSSVDGTAVDLNLDLLVRETRYLPQKSGASEIDSQELIGAPRAHYQIDRPRTVALRKLKLDEVKVLFEV